MLAKELGIGTVLYNDIYDVSCRDAKAIGEAIGCAADHYIEGDIDEVVGYVRRHSIACDAVGSYDVIEHVYDTEGFLKKLSLLSARPLAIVMASSVNSLNPRRARHFSKKQVDVEYHDRHPEPGHKERDSLRAYIDIRKEIIRSHAAGLKAAEVDALARATRGMIEADIKSAVEDYLKTKKISARPAHPTNTCDPYTGNWADRLMDPYRIAGILSEEGFRAEVLKGYYFDSSLLRKAANAAIFLLGKHGIRLAPFFAVHAVRQ